MPIVQRHLEILEPVRGLNKQFVFPSTKSEKGYIGRPVRLRWSPHAHRRTFATVAMEAGVLEEIVGRLLNHTPKGAVEDLVGLAALFVILFAVLSLPGLA